MSAPHAPDPVPPAATDDASRRFSTVPPRDFAELAKRISGRTTDLFAVALVVVVLSYLGVQVTRWWRASPPTVSAGPAVGGPLAVWDIPGDLAVEFDGGPWRLARSPATGTADAVARAAVDQARRLLETQISGLPLADEAELQWLEQLHDWPPQLQTELGDVFVLGGPWPWIVATRSTLATRTETRDRSHAADSNRVICWIFAVPNSDQHWTVYTAMRSDDDATRGADELIAIPDGARRLISARSAAGRVTSFRSGDSLPRLRESWDRRLREAGWSLTGNWSDDAGVVRATYRRQRDEDVEQLEAALMQDEAGGVSGVADCHRQ